MDDIKYKLYIVNLEFHNWIKRLYLEGEDNEKAEKAFEQACIDLNSIRNSSKEFSEFLERAIRHFGDRGFSRIKK